MMNTKRLLTFLGCFLAVLMLWPHPGSGAGQQDGAQAGQQIVNSEMEQARLGEEMARYGFTEEQRLRFREMVQNANRFGLADGPLQEKMREGMAKGYDGQLILGAVQQVANRYRAAYGQVRVLELGDVASVSLGDALAQAYAAGLRQEEMEPVMTRLRERLMAMEGEQRYELALQLMVTAREAARRQIRSSEVCQQLEEALRLSYGPGEVAAMRYRYEQRARHGAEQSEPGSAGSGGGGDTGNGRGGGDKSNGQSGGAGASNSSGQAQGGGQSSGSTGQGGSGGSSSGGEASGSAGQDGSGGSGSGNSGGDGNGSGGRG